MTSTQGLEPTTPILVGAGQASDPIDADGYRRWSAVDLAAAAARRAIDDAGIDVATIDTVGGIRQFETSTPGAEAPLGRSDNFPRSVAARVAATPRRAVLEVGGGQGPQHLITEFAKAIHAGEAGTVLLFGSEAISTTRALAGREDAPDFSEHADGELEDRGYGIDGLVNPYELDHGLRGAPATYAIFDNARRHRLGLSRAAQADQIGELFAPFTRVAAANPFAAAPTERSASELVTITERNRLIADPYPRFVVARDQVNQGAAVVLTSVAAARSEGIPEERWVFLHGYSDLRERNVLDRPDLSRSPASVQAAQTALTRAGTSVGDIARFDLYSCFAIPVLNICEGLGIAHDDPRGLTLTGGLPFFGGAGNNYSMHAVAETLRALRDQPGSLGFVGANGGYMSKYSAAVYSTAPAPFQVWSDAEVQAVIDSEPAPVLAEHPQGTATVETYTVTTDVDRSWIGIVVGRLADGSRTLATTAPDDQAALSFLTSEDPFDGTFTVTPSKPRNRASDFRPAAG